jgi:hypothetical protein
MMPLSATLPRITHKTILVPQLKQRHRPRHSTHHTAKTQAAQAAMRHTHPPVAVKLTKQEFIHYFGTVLSVAKLLAKPLLGTHMCYIGPRLPHMTEGPNPTRGA